MARCNSCGQDVPDGVKFCTSCGAGVGTAPQQEAAPVPAAAPIPAAAPVPAAYGDPKPAKGSIYAPIGTLGYIGYTLLFAIPILGQVLLFMWAFGKKGNVNRRNLARAMLVFLACGLIIGILSWILVGSAAKAAAEAAGADTSGGLIAWVQGLAGDSETDDPYGMDDSDDADQPDDTQNSGGTQSTKAADNTTAEPAEYDYGDGSVFTAQWPENDLTRQVPKPDFEVGFGSSTDTEFAALGSGASVAQLRDYTKKLQKAGFTKDTETTDESFFGMETYSYKASNKKGYQVEVAYALGASTITIRKPS